MATSGTHVVFGAGQVGSFLAEELVNQGLRVRVAKRSSAPVPEGAELSLGDAGDAAFCRQAVSGAQVVYHCINPAYSARAWETVLPRVLDNLIGAAGAAGARLVVMENLYMVGQGSGGPIDEDTPTNPLSRKGELRARLAERLFTAHQRGDVRAVSGRASDFYGPRGEATHFGSQFWPAALAGKPADFLPNPDTTHSFHYIPDVASGLAALGTAEEDVLGRPWILPCAPAETSRALVARLSAALGKEIRLRGMPRPVLKLVGLFVPILRELAEMLHQWEVPFVVDDSRFRERFGTEATDLDVGAAATVAWAKSTFGHGPARRR